MTSPVPIVNTRRLKQIIFTVNGVTGFECQLQSWTINNNTPEGQRQYTFCPNGQFVEEADPAWTLDLRFFSDWRSQGVSHFLWTNRGLPATITIRHHPGIIGEEKQFTVQTTIRAPSVGGDARTTEQTSVTLTIAGEPDYQPMS